MINEKPFWETGVHPVTGKVEIKKVMTEEQKRRRKFLKSQKRKNQN